MSVAAPLVLRPGDGARLRELTRSSVAPAGLVQRARMALLAADGVANAAIGRQVGVSTPTVLAWRNRYDAGGMDALVDQAPFGSPPVIDDAAIIIHTLNPPPDALAVTHCRLGYWPAT
jgi:transposase